MNMHDAPAQTELGLEEQKTTRTRFLGHWLLLVRTGWLIVALLSVTLFVVSIPPFYDQLLTHSVFNLNDPAGVPARLAQLGLSIDFYAAYVTVLIIMMASVFFLVAMLIFWRKSDEWMPLIVSLVLVMFGAIFPNTLDALATAYPVLRLPTGVLDYVGFLSFFMLFYLFPDGRFVPRWTCWLALLAIVLTIPTFFFPQSVLDMNTWPPLLAVPLYMCLFGSFMGAQIYRYRRVSTQIQRQQTKWVMFGFLTAAIAFIGFSLPNVFFPSLTRSGSLYDLVYLALLGLCFSLVPLSIGFAILKYRLYDIDVLINRALVYGTLTGALALVYVSLVFALQFLLQGLIGQTSGIAIVVSTLAIAALFNPLRRRIQTFIDRRFYRHKYDAAKTLAAFGTMLRNEVNLDNLSEQLVAVVQETMQPAHVSLWLRPPEPSRKQKTWLLARIDEEESVEP